METKNKGSVKKRAKPNLNGPNSPTPKRSVHDRDLEEDEQKQITNIDSVEEDLEKDSHSQDENSRDREDNAETANGKRKEKKRDRSIS